MSAKAAATPTVHGAVATDNTIDTLMKTNADADPKTDNNTTDMIKTDMDDPLFGIKIKDLYLIRMCADPDCTNLVWSSSPAAEIVWPKLPSEDGYNSEEDEDDPEVSQYGILRRYCGRVGSWHIHDIVLRGPEVKAVAAKVLKIHPGFKENRVKDEDGWVFRPPFKVFLDRRAQLEAYRDGGHEDSGAAGALIEVIDSVSA